MLTLTNLKEEPLHSRLWFLFSGGFFLSSGRVGSQISTEDSRSYQVTTVLYVGV